METFKVEIGVKKENLLTPNTVLFSFLSCLLMLSEITIKESVSGTRALENLLTYTISLPK